MTSFKMGQKHIIELPADFGDKKTVLSVLHPEKESDILTVLFHGSYGCANFREGNKYAHLARIFAGKGISSCLVETSRKRRDRHAYSEDRAAWIGAAFQGKTFVQELQEVCAALIEIARVYPQKRLWLIGFSLGGILAYLALSDVIKDILALEDKTLPGLIPHAEALILAGSGERSDSHSAATLPILSSRPQLMMDPSVGKGVCPGRMIGFYGSDDDTFTEESCRLLLQYCGLPEDRKFFHVLDGVDHRFRFRNGIPSGSILREMVDLILADSVEG